MELVKKKSRNRFNILIFIVIDNRNSFCALIVLKTVLKHGTHSNACIEKRGFTKACASLRVELGGPALTVVHVAQRVRAPPRPRVRAHSVASPASGTRAARIFRIGARGWAAALRHDRFHRAASARKLRPDTPRERAKHAPAHEHLHQQHGPPHHPNLRETNQEERV